MHDRHRLKIAIAALVILGLFALGASAMQQSAWSDGYTMGLLAAKGGDGAVQMLPYAMHGRGIHGFGFGSPFGSPFGFVLGFFKFGFVLLFLFMIAKFFGFGRWHHAGYHGGHWPHQHGPWQGGNGGSGTTAQEQRSATPSTPTNGPSNGDSKPAGDGDGTSVHV